MKPSEALRLARDILASQKCGCFVCHTLPDIDAPGAYKAEAHIREMLDAHTGARLCRIDDMIEYWESKGE
jgi:hypothetical protein